MLEILSFVTRRYFLQFVLGSMGQTTLCLGNGEDTCRPASRLPRLPSCQEHNPDLALISQIREGWAELQYTSWWDGSGMKFEMGGMDPTCRHPKPRPTNPRDFFDTSLLLYRKGMNTNHDSVNFWDSGRKSETFISYLPASFGPPNKSSIQSFSQEKRLQNCPIDLKAHAHL